MKNITTIILAAGQGTRLRPLTENCPKCMVKFLGQPLIQYQIQALNKAEITDINLVGGYKHDFLPNNVNKTYLNQKFFNTNMVYSLFLSRELMTGESDIIISYGDIIYEPKHLHKLIESNDRISITVDIEWKKYWSARMENPIDDVETFKWDAETRIISEIGKKPETLQDIQGQYIGLIKFRADAVLELRGILESTENIYRDTNKSLEEIDMTTFLQYLIDRGIILAGVPIENGWLEFDTVKDMEAYNKLNSTGDLSRFFNISEFEFR